MQFCSFILNEAGGIRKKINEDYKVEQVDFSIIILCCLVIFCIGVQHI